MDKATSGNLVVPNTFLDHSQKTQSIVSLDRFQSPSPLPFHGFSAEQEVLFELAEVIQLDGAKAAINGDLQRIKEILRATKKHSCDYLIDLATEDEGYNMLHYAVCYKRLPIIQYLINNGASPECTTKDDEHDTPLMLAIRYYDSYSVKHHQVANTLERSETSYQVVEYLLKKTKLSSHNASGTTSLSLAVQKQNQIVIKMLLEMSDTEINKQNHQGYAPLHFACAGENTNIITMLLEKDADLFCKTEKGFVPLHIACRRGSVGVLEHLIQKCPEENRQELLETEDNLGNTPLLLAKEAPTTEAFDLLQTTYKLDIHAKNNNGDGIFHKFAKEDDGVLNAQLLDEDECVMMLDESNHKRDTPLHVACQLGHWKSVVLFIEKGASHAVKNVASNTPLMTAIIAGNLEVLLHVLKAISNTEHVSIRDILSLPAKNNKSIFTWAIESDHTVLIDAVTQVDLNLSTENDPDSGKSLLHIAAASGALAIINVLLCNKHVVEQLQHTDCDGKTPLMLAAQNGHLECVETLHCLESVAVDTDNTDGHVCGDLSLVDNDGYTALHLACLNGHLRVVDYLCTSGAELEACDCEDGTPLACAASQGHVKVLNYLLARDVAVNGGYGKVQTTPLILASKNGHEKCVLQLLQHPHIDVTLQNGDGHNCLASAADRGYLQTALAIVNSRHWREALTGCDKYGATPLRLLIKYIPGMSNLDGHYACHPTDAAEVVLYRCIRWEENEKGQEVALEMSYEYLDDFDDSPGGGIRGFYNSMFGTTPDNGTLGLRTLPEAVQLNSTKAPKRFDKNNHVLHWMVRYERTNLLQHPVTHELLSYKWRAYAMPAFIVNLAIYLVFLAFLTVFVIVLPLPKEGICDGGRHCDEDSDSEQVFLRFAATLLLTYCGFRTVTEILELLSRGRYYLTEPENYLEILLIGSTATVAVVGHAEKCFCLESYAWQFGALAVFLGWIDLVMYLRKLPITGIPISMLQNVIWTFLKLIYLPTILIVAFSLPFYMLFTRPEVDTSFDTTPLSLRKLLVMFSGEMEYEQIFRFRGSQDDAPIGSINYPLLSNILWVVFVLLMPILFINLLIGLAVGDTQKAEKKATLTYLSLQVNLALEVEEKFSWIRRKLKKTTQRIEKNPTLPFFQRWYRSAYDALCGKSYKQLVKEVNRLNTDEKLSTLLQGKESLEPIDDVKAQVLTNTNAVLEIKTIVDQLIKESAEAKKRDQELLSAIKELKQDVKKKATSVCRSKMISDKIQEFVVKFEGNSEET